MEFFTDLLESYKLLKKRKLRVTLNEDSPIPPEVLKDAEGKAIQFVQQARGGVEVQVVGTQITLFLKSAEQDIVAGFAIPGFTNAPAGVKVWQSGAPTGDILSTRRNAWKQLVRAIAIAEDPGLQDREVPDDTSALQGLTGEDLLGISDASKTLVTVGMEIGMDRLNKSINEFVQNIEMMDDSKERSDWFELPTTINQHIDSNRRESVRVKLSNSRTRTGFDDDNSPMYEPLDEGWMITTLELATTLFDSVSTARKDIDKLSNEQAQIFAQQIREDKYGVHYKATPTSEWLVLFRGKGVGINQDYGKKSVDEWNKMIDRQNNDRDLEGLERLPKISVKTETAAVSGRYFAVRGVVGEHMIGIGEALGRAKSFEKAGDQTQANLQKEIAIASFKSLHNGPFGKEIFEVFQDQLDLQNEEILGTEQYVTHSEFADSIQEDAKKRGFTSSNPIALVTAANGKFTKGYYKFLGANPDGTVQLGSSTEAEKGKKADLGDVFHSRAKIEKVAKNLGASVESLVKKGTITTGKASDVYKNSSTRDLYLKTVDADSTVWVVGHELKMRNDTGAFKGGESSLAAHNSDFLGNARETSKFTMTSDEKRFLTKVESTLPSFTKAGRNLVAEKVASIETKVDERWSTTNPAETKAIISSFRNTVMRGTKSSISFAQQRTLSKQITHLENDLGKLARLKRTKGQDENAKSEYESIQSKVKSNLDRLKSLHSRVIITSHLDRLFNSDDPSEVIDAVSYLAHSFLYTGGSETEVFKDSRNLTTGDHFVFPNNKSLEGPVKGLLQEEPTHALARNGSSWTIYEVGEDKKADFTKPTVSLGIEEVKGRNVYVQKFTKGYLDRIAKQELSESSEFDQTLLEYFHHQEKLFLLLKEKTIR